MYPLTVIIILNWNGLDNTINCLNSVIKIKYENFRIIVIDNGSKVNERVLLKNKFKNKIHVLRLEENKGFTGGVNTGIKLAREKYNPDFYLLLNNDTEVDQYFLKSLVEAALSDPKIGIVGSKILDYYERNKIVYSSGEVNWWLAKPYRKNQPHSDVVETTIITGCAMLIKKEVIEKIGLFDEKFFAYFEDSAYCLTAIKAGFLCVCDGRSIVYHIENASSGRNSQLFTYLFSRNRILFVNGYTSLIYKIYFLFFNTLKLIFVLAYLNITRQYNRSRAYLNGFYHGLLGQIGKPYKFLDNSNI